MQQRTAAITAGAVVVAGLTAILIAGAVAPPLICTAEGYVESVDIKVSGSGAADVTAMGFCTDEGCERVPAHPAKGRYYEATRRNAHLWNFPTGTAPAHVAVTAYGGPREAHTTLATQGYDLEWRRIYPGDQCRLWRETDPLRLQVP